MDRLCYRPKNLTFTLIGPLLAFFGPFLAHYLSIFSSIEIIFDGLPKDEIILEKPLKMFTRLSQPDPDKYSTKNVYPSSELSPAPLLCGR